MINFDASNTILFIVDIQEKLLNAVFNKDTLQKSSEILTKASNILNIPVIITEQYPKGLGTTANFILDSADSNNVRIFEKTNFNALADKDLFKYLKNKKKKNVILCGIEAHICIYQTAVALINAGYKVTLIKNACGSRSEDEYLTALDILSRNNVEIKTVEMVLFELLKSAKHPKFKEVQSLIK